MECPQCDKKFSRKFNMERHIKVVHQKKEDAAISKIISKRKLMPPHPISQPLVVDKEREDKI